MQIAGTGWRSPNPDVRTQLTKQDYRNSSAMPLKFILRKVMNLLDARHVMINAPF
jgi:hypothetical protein